MTYTIVLIPDAGRVSVSVPAMPGIHTWGNTEAEAIASAREAIELHLEGYLERGLPYPKDRLVRPQLGRRERLTLARISINAPVVA